jgi:hypothetical protein
LLDLFCSALPFCWLLVLFIKGLTYPVACFCSFPSLFTLVVNIYLSVIR